MVLSSALCEIAQSIIRYEHVLVLVYIHICVITAGANSYFREIRNEEGLISPLSCNKKIYAHV